MKRILVALMVLISATTHAQTATAINVHNTSGCTVYYQLMMSGVGTVSCPVANYAPSATTVYSIAPGEWQSYKGTSVFAPYDVLRQFLGARFYKSTLACSPSFTSIGVACTGFPAGAVVTTYDATCTICGNVTAVFAYTGGGISTLTFN